MVLTGRRHSRGTIRSLIEAGIPIVEMWEMSDQPIDTVVGFSQRGTGERAARHFAERGARRLGFVGAALDRDYRAADRHAGFVEAALQAGCEEPAAIRLPERASGTAGAEGLARLMAAYPEVDAVLFSNDALALGGLFEAQRKGWAVPGRLKVCGFGDLEFAAATQPALTTIRPPRREIGARIAEILRSRLTLIPQNGPRFAGEDDAEAKSPKQRAGPSGAFDLGFELVVRGSS